MNPTFIEILKNAIGKEQVFESLEKLEKHSTDESGAGSYLPELVVEPQNVNQVSKILKICNHHKIPVTVQGGLSGVSGGALPVLGGIVMSMKQLNRIIDIDKDNFQVIVEPAIITEHLQNILKEEGLFYPPDPAGRGWSFIGGNIGTNAGGPRCCKYGVTRDFVLNLEIVLPTGEIMWTGANTLKNSTGYNLTQLLVGSEGTLAVVTKIVLKVLPHPAYNLLMMASFDEPSDACAAVAEIYKAGVNPSALEFMEDKCVDFAARYVGIEPRIRLHQLIIEVDGNDLDVLHKDCETIAVVLEKFNVKEILFADSEAQKDSLWHLRRNAGGAILKLAKAHLSEDTVVPRAKLPDLLQEVKHIAQKYDVITTSLGHLGDGNMHIFILTESDPTQQWHQRAKAAKRAIFETVKKMNGMLSAEHGVGFTQLDYVDIFLNETHRNLLRGIKNVFDPNHILNPGKIV